MSSLGRLWAELIEEEEMMGVVFNEGVVDNDRETGVDFLSSLISVRLLILIDATFSDDTTRDKNIP